MSVKCRFLGLFLFLASCGGSPTWRLLPVPENRDQRSDILRTAGRSIYRSLVEGNSSALYVPEDRLADLMDAGAIERLRRARRVGLLRPVPEPVSFLAFRQNQFRSACLQNSRLEPAGTTMGLRQPAWVFDRVLIVGGTSPRFAAWVEGTFVYTSEGFRALLISRVETPRWEHADLELATCDLEAGPPSHHM